MTPKLEFTDKEKLMVQYYRDPRLCSLSRHVSSAMYYFVPAVVLTGIAVVEDSVVWAFVGFGLLFVYECYQLFQARHWADVMPSIIAKYEAHIEALEKEVAERGR